MMVGQETKESQEWNDMSPKRDQISYLITLNRGHLFQTKKKLNPYGYSQFQKLM